MGKDFSVCETTADLRKLDAASVDLRIRGLRDGDVPELARFRDVRELDFFCGIRVMDMRLTAVGFRILAEQEHPHLAAIVIDRAPTFDDECFRAVCSFPSLTEVIVRRSGAFTAEGLGCALSLPNLTDLDLRGCEQIDDEWVPLLSRFRSLRKLHLTETAISPDGVARLRSLLPSVEIDVDPAHWKWATGE